MKKNIFLLMMILFIAYILGYPEESMHAAADGLVLWYERVLPALLPFSILSNILIYSGLLAPIMRRLANLVRFLIPLSDAGAFVLFSGFLFGFPMGSKNCSELLKNGQISLAEAEILFIITNNIGPVFISGFIFHQQLHLPELALPGIALLYLPPLLFGSLLLRRQKNKESREKQAQLFAQNSREKQKNPASGSQMNFKIIDAGIMNGFETLAKLGGYIMLFSMAASLIKQLPLPVLYQTIGIGATEITNGIREIGLLSANTADKFLLAMGFAAFGGISGLAQTASMVKGTGLSMKKYITGKLCLTAVTVCLSICYLKFFC